MKLHYLYTILLSITISSISQTTQWRVIWDKNPGNNLSEYIVFKGTKPTPTQEITKVKVQDTIYIDKNISPTQPACYVF